MQILAFLLIHLAEGTLHVQQSWCVEWSCTWDVLPALAWGAKRGKVVVSSLPGGAAVIGVIFIAALSVFLRISL